MSNFIPNKSSELIYHDFIVAFLERTQPQMLKLPDYYADRELNNSVAIDRLLGVTYRDVPVLDTGLYGADTVSLLDISFPIGGMYALSLVKLYKSGEEYAYETGQTDPNMNNSFYDIVSGPEITPFIVNLEAIPTKRNEQGIPEEDLNAYINRRQGNVDRVPGNFLGRFMLYALDLERQIIERRGEI